MVSSLNRRKNNFTNKKSCKFRNKFTAFSTFFLKNIEKNQNMLYDEKGKGKKL